MQTLPNRRRVWQLRLSYPTAACYGVLERADADGEKVEGVTMWDVVTANTVRKIKTSE